jgi:hypothetical protein
MDSMRWVEIQFAILLKKFTIPVNPDVWASRFSSSLARTDMNVLGVDEPSVLRPHIITSRFSLRNLVPSDTSPTLPLPTPPPRRPFSFLSVVF